MKTTGARVEAESGWERQVENIREPGGDTHTFEPRPRPDVWIVAVAVKPGGSFSRRVGFLGEMVSL